MKGKRKTGYGHYREKLGLKPIVVYVQKKTHAGLMRLADKTGESLQATVRKILENRVKLGK